jgi:peptidoglycan hydrolase-like protein with peptidoglycan-binding domain
MAEIIGVDYGSPDGNDAPNFQAAKQAGVRFVIVRAVYGRSLTTTPGPYLDPTWGRDKDAIRAAGLKRGAYLFLCFDRTGKTTPSPEAQVQAYADYVGLLPFQDFPPLLDVEEDSDVMSPSEMYDWIVRAAQAMAARYGIWPGIYTSNRVWQENLLGHAAGSLARCPLWIAKPWPWAVGSPAHLDGAPSYQPTTIPQFGDTTNWWLYQYQGDAKGVPGFSSTTDLSRCHLVRQSDRGTIVSWIQARVKTAVDGIFGPNTQAAVKTVQLKYGLAQDGIVGPDTFAVLAWTSP